MKKVSLVVGFILFFCFFGVGQGIRFEKKGFKHALEKARSTNKLLFVEMYTQWCGPCKMMDKDVFSDVRVGTFFNEHFISIKLDVETPEGSQVQKDYDLVGLPGFGFINGEGESVLHARAYKTVDEFLFIANEAIKASRDPSNLGRLQARYFKEKDNEEFLVSYLAALKKNNISQYVDVLEQFLKIQKRMLPEQLEMIQFLYVHNDQLVFGGLADSIIESNRNTAWKYLLRKDLRAWNKKLFDVMCNNTLKYAIHGRDRGKLDMLVNRMEEMGTSFSKDLYYANFYLKIGAGEEYKKIIYPKAEKLYSSIDVQKVQAEDRQRVENVKKLNLKHTRVVLQGEQLGEQLSAYARSCGSFADTSEELKTALNWSEKAVLIAPESVLIQNNHADLLYMFGDKEKGIELKQNVLERANKYQRAMIENTLKNMKNGQNIE